MSLITIGNDGINIAETNYWDSEYARAGKIFFSVNRGCIRMLIPDAMLYIIPEIKTGEKVIVLRGEHLQLKRSDAFVFIFEDYSDAPFSLHVGTEQWDVIPTLSQLWLLSAWTRTGKVYERQCNYRVVDSLPCLRS